jgi:hypothetical protein
MVESTEIQLIPKVVDVLGTENQIQNPTFAGIADGGAPGGPWVSDGILGATATQLYQPRVRVNAAEIPVGLNATRSAFAIRFDYSYATYFSYPISLKPNTWYEFSTAVIAWDSRINLPVDFVVSSSVNGLSNVLFQQTFYTPGTANTAETQHFRFKTPAADSAQTYYLTFRNATGTSIVGITNLTLVENDVVLNSLIIGKNYSAGSTKMRVLSVRYSDGAYAPGVKVSLSDHRSISDIQLFSTNRTLYLSQLPDGAVVQIFDLSGRCVIRQKAETSRLSIPLNQGFYIACIKSSSHIQSGKVLVQP